MPKVTTLWLVLVCLSLAGRVLVPSILLEHLPPGVYVDPEIGHSQTLATR